MNNILQNSQASLDLGTCGGLNVKLSQQVNTLLGEKAQLEESLGEAQVLVRTQNKRISNVSFIACLRSMVSYQQLLAEHKNAVDEFNHKVATLTDSNLRLKKDLEASARREDDLRAQLDEIYSSEVLNNIRNCSVLPASPFQSKEHLSDTKLESAYKRSSSSIVSYIEDADTVRTSHDVHVAATLDTSKTSEDDSFFQLSDTDTEHETSLELYDSPDRIMKSAFCS